MTAATLATVNATVELTARRILRDTFRNCQSVSAATAKDTIPPKAHPTTTAKTVS